MDQILFDAYGRYVSLDALREEKSGPTLTGVRQPLGAHPAQGLTPQKLGLLLSEAEQGVADRYLELAEEMEEKDLHYAAVLSSRKRAVAGLPITVEAASDNAEDLRAAEIIEDFLTRDELKEELFHIQDAIGKGYSVTEIIWEIDGDIWTPKRLAYRDPTFFEFDRLGETLLLRTEEGPQPLDCYKYIIHRSSAKSGIPIRGGLARAAAWGYMFKNYTLKAWTMFLEVFGLPLRLGKYGQGASQQDKETLLRAVRDVASDAAAIIPDNMTMEFISGTASGEGTNSFFTNADYWDKQISKLVLGQTGTTDTGQYVGTSEAHQATQFDIEVSDAVQLAATLNRDLIRPMIDLNLGPRPGRLYPKVRLAREKREDLTALVSQIIQLVPLGLQVEESVMRDKLGIPEPAENAKLLTPAAAVGMAGAMGGEYDTLDTPDTPDIVEPVDTPAEESLPAEPEAPPSEAAPPEAAEVEGVSPKVALNGAQLQAAMAVIQQVAIGALPRSSGLGLLTMGFGLSDEEAERVMAEAGKGFVPIGQEGAGDKPANKTLATASQSAAALDGEPVDGESDDGLEENRSTIQSDLDSKRAADDWESLVGPAIAKVYELAESCQSHDELKKAILKTASEGGLDLSALEDDLAGKMFKASLGGAGIR
jgi:phage gp29-like protein